MKTTINAGTLPLEYAGTTDYAEAIRKGEVRFWIYSAWGLYWLEVTDTRINMLKTLVLESKKYPVDESFETKTIFDGMVEVVPGISERKKTVEVMIPAEIGEKMIEDGKMWWMRTFNCSEVIQQALGWNGME